MLFDVHIIRSKICNSPNNVISPNWSNDSYQLYNAPEQYLRMKYCLSGLSINSKFTVFVSRNYLLLTTQNQTVKTIRKVLSFWLSF